MVDSPFVVHLLRWSVEIPAATFWGFWSQLVSGSAIAWFVWMLARGRIKSERWHERKADLYHRIVDDLYVIQEYASPQAEDEERASSALPPLHSPAEYESMRPEVERAEREIRRYSEVGPFLLTPEAFSILEEYRRKLRDPDETGTTWPIGGSLGLTRECWREFSERARYDLGQMGALRYHYRRAKRMARRGYNRTRSRVEGLMFGMITRWEEWRLTFGPQLTQSDVRWPPKYQHFRSVEQMQRAGFRRGQIQRELRLQLRADPGPPWSPLPEWPARKRPPP